MALGSGSSNQRRSIVQLNKDGLVTISSANELYQLFDQTVDFSGSELNIECAVAMGNGLIRLFNRGNGAPRNKHLAVNASCDLSGAELFTYLETPAHSPMPRLANLQRYDLGGIEGKPLSFTDACIAHERLLYCACSEASPDARTDGAVTGSAIGQLDGNGNGRWIELRDRQGQVVLEKVEGICAMAGNWTGLYGVLDTDDPTRPTELCEIRLSGDWI